MESMGAFRSESPDQGAVTPKLARGLGWFSLALGAAEVVMPKTLARIIGVDPRGRAGAVIRILGAREIATGLGVLARPRSPLPLWARVAGDVVDLALLGVAARTGKRSRTSPARLAGTAVAIAGIAALDVWAARRAMRATASRPVLAAVTINKPPAEVYAFFRKLERLPLFMNYLESVTEHGDTSHWIAKLPTGRTVSWNARITADRPGELIAWQTVEGSPIAIRGRVTFTRTPGRNLTEVRVEMQLGVLRRPSAALAKLFAKPQVKGDLRRFKQVVETGEVLYSDASGRRGQRPAQPAEPGEQPQPTMFFPNPPTAGKGVAR